ncbi:MAG: DNA alkylation repair protein [Chloroflexi bacterium]|nr:DNA alkylation repair protein [Chloroflexota bacterium]
MADFPLLKDYIDGQLVTQLAERITVAHPQFASDAFVAAASGELQNLELKGRFDWIADQLRATLPADYPTALNILLRILDIENGRFATLDMPEFRLMPIPTFVFRHGLEHPDVSLDAIPIITRHATCEGAIRPFIRRYPTATLARLHKWARHDNEHVRRLVSEGTRPRLPWWSPLREFIADPAPVLALLECLKDDPSLYVRRSVANNLNDISKDHPRLALERMAAWSEGASNERQWLINHALRTLVKRGDKSALAILGYAPAEVELSHLTVTPTVLQFGKQLEFSFVLQNCGGETQKLMVDFVMHFVKANGSTAPKVFKLKKLSLPAGEKICVQKKMAIRPISTRKYYAGRQRLEIQVNGACLGGADFELVMD